METVDQLEYNTPPNDKTNKVEDKSLLYTPVKSEKEIDFIEVTDDVKEIFSETYKRNSNPNCNLFPIIPQCLICLQPKICHAYDYNIRETEPFLNRKIYPRILDIKPEFHLGESWCNICFESKGGLMVPCCLAICVDCGEKDFYRQLVTKKFICPFDGEEMDGNKLLQQLKSFHVKNLPDSVDFNTFDTNYCQECSSPIIHFTGREVACSNKDCNFF